MSYVKSQNASHFGDPRAEYAAARDDCAMFDVSQRSQIEVTGADRVKFLHNFCTNDIKVLMPGQGCEAFCTNVKGRVVGHIFAFCDDASLWVETVEDAAATLLPHLDRYIITEDVQLHDRTALYGELFVSGPRAAERLAGAGIDVAALQIFEHFMAHLDGVPVVVRRVDWLLQPGYLLSVAREKLSIIWERLVSNSIRPAGSTAFDVLRIEAGFPQYGVDVGDDNLAQEVNRTPQAISFTKGCYLGQEPIARIDAMGHVNRALRTVRLEPGVLPKRGAVVVSPEDGKEIGAVTSSARLADDEQAVALAYLRSHFLAAGTKVAVRDGVTTAAATVVEPDASTK
jgi:folate-binding protein YgfZ